MALLRQTPADGKQHLQYVPGGVPTPARSLTNSSLNSEGTSTAERPEKMKDVSLRIRGTSKMNVRGRRKRMQSELDAEISGADKRQRNSGPDGAQVLPQSAASSSALPPAVHHSARDEEVARWSQAAPQCVRTSFKNGLEDMFRRLASKPVNRLREVLQRFAQRRAGGDPEGSSLAWMESFVVAIMAVDLGVHIHGPSSTHTSGDCTLLPNTGKDAAASFEDDHVPVVGTRQQTLRISAGRAAAAAGIHPFTDVGELFLELVYQDLPELLIRDAAVAGVEVISGEEEKERLLEKSGVANVLRAILDGATRSQTVMQAQAAREAIERTVKSAKLEGSLTDDEAAELLNALQLDINLDFGERHEDSALAAYEARVGARNYGDQHRVKVAMPRGGPAEALARFPSPGSACRSSIEAAAASSNSKAAAGSSTVEAGQIDAAEDAFFYITGFTDGIVDIPREASANGQMETLVVEMKHRMGKVRDPPNIYDVVQLSTYCHALGCARGDLVQCLRNDATAAGSSHELHITRLNFALGSPDRQGFDEHVLPSLYKMAAAVYEVRSNDRLRLELLKAADPAARTALVGQLVPHLDR
jgi:hypothetical protein